MKVAFTCPGCGVSGSLLAAHAGKIIRCKHCGFRSAAPSAGEPEGDIYALDVPATENAGDMDRVAVEGSVFVASGRDDPTRAPRPRRPIRTVRRSNARKREDRSPWRNWLIGCAVLIALALAAVALLAPQGTLIAGCVLIVIGSVMLMTGYFVGAYGAFREDSLYGFLYLVIPLYTAYYLVTRWDDLWVWCTCSTVGVGLILLGTEIVRWTGVVA
jgi:hypothetical protein